MCCWLAGCCFSKLQPYKGFKKDIERHSCGSLILRALIEGGFKPPKTARQIFVSELVQMKKFHDGKKGNHEKKGALENILSCVSFMFSCFQCFSCLPSEVDPCLSFCGTPPTSIWRMSKEKQEEIHNEIKETTDGFSIVLKCFGMSK
jgi:hypothetical protein